MTMVTGRWWPVADDRPIIGYAFEPEQIEALQQINTRLFHYTALTPDERRDLANRMQVIMWKAIPLHNEDTIRH